jgi:hypothetical protein
MNIETTSGHTILADDSDYELLSAYSWYVVKTTDGRLYAQAHIRGDRQYKRISMHRLLMQPPPHLVVHHRNNNGLDNRRLNLEITTNRQNILYAYQGKPCCAYKNGNRWQARVRGTERKLVYLGSYATKEEAVAVSAKFKAETRL